MSAAAERLGTTVGRMHYWVGRFCELGLLHVTRTAGRAGRAIKHYRAAAETFFIPFSATPAETLEALLSQHDARLQRPFSEGLVRAFLTGIDAPEAWGIRIRGEGQQGLEWGRADSSESCSLLELLRQAHAPAIVSSTQTLALTQKEALELQGDLLEVWERYEAKLTTKAADPKGRKPYLLRLGLAPIELG